MSTVPIDDRTQTLRLYDSGLVTPYVQNWNVSLQREIVKDSVLTVRYVGTKGTRLLSGPDLNQGEIFSNGFLDAFNVIARAGTLRCSTRCSPDWLWPAGATWTA